MTLGTTAFDVKSNITREDISFKNGESKYIVYTENNIETKYKLSELITAFNETLLEDNIQQKFLFYDEDKTPRKFIFQRAHLFPTKNIEAINAVIEEKNQRIDSSLIYSILNFALRFFSFNFLSLKNINQSIGSIRIISQIETSLLQIAMIDTSLMKLMDKRKN